ncbi:hypothetical protein FI667_g10821, partial [Globisporangium splendens]
MVTEWPRPNAFLSAIAYGSLEQFGLSVEKQYPFLNQVITEVGASMHSNFDDLQQCWTREQQKGMLQYYSLSSSSNRFLFYFEHGQHWFHALAEQQHAIESLKLTTAASKAECQRLHE